MDGARQVSDAAYIVLVLGIILQIAVVVFMLLRVMPLGTRAIAASGAATGRIRVRSPFNSPQIPSLSKVGQAATKPAGTEPATQPRTAGIAELNRYDNGDVTRLNPSAYKHSVRPQQRGKRSPLPLKYGERFAYILHHKSVAGMH